jgi:hypothetical protein
LNLIPSLKGVPLQIKCLVLNPVVSGLTQALILVLKPLAAYS